MPQRNGTKTRVHDSSPAALGDTVECPACGIQIILSQALLAHLQKSAEEQMQRELVAARTRMETELSNKAKALESELESTRKQLMQAKEGHLALLRRERELDDLAKKIELQAEEQLAMERQKIRVTERQRAEHEAKRSLREREEELAVLREHLDRAEHNEGELRRKQTDLKAREDALELEVQRRLDPLRDSLARDLSAKAQESAAIEVQRREIEITRLREKIAQLSKPTVASEPAGESLETMLRSVLERACPLDMITDVAKGQKGADLIHIVRNAAQTKCGCICWEAKNTKTWDKAWTAKTKQAQRDADADLAVIVATALPDGIKYLGQLDGVWLCAPSAVAGFAVLIRHMLLRITDTKLLSETRDARLQALGDYIGSNHFRLAAENVVGLVRQMEEQLESEQKSLSRAWQKRRQYLLALGGQVAEVIGSLEGAVRRDLIGEIEPVGELSG